MDTYANERLALIGTDMDRALKSIPQPAYLDALNFVEVYFLPCFEIFPGDFVLDAYRAAKRPYAERNWRNQWGGFMNHLKGKRKQLIVAVGTTDATKKQCHDREITMWRSLLYTGRKYVNPSIRPVAIQLPLELE